MANLAERKEPTSLNPRAVWAAIDELRDTVRFLRSSRDLIGRATVDAGKNLLVRGMLKVIGNLDLTGTMSMKNADGDEIVRLGDMPLGDKGVAFTRAGGSTAFLLRKEFVPENPQTWSLYDDAGNIIVAEQSLFGGLSRPFLEMPFQPVAAASGTAVTCGPYGWERTHNTTSWTTLFVHEGKRQNQGVDLVVAAKCSDGTTAGEVRVVNEITGTQLGSFLLGPWTGVVPAGTTSFIVLDPGTGETMLAEFAVHAAMRIGIQVRRTAGTGTITLAVPQAIGG